LIIADLQLGGVARKVLGRVDGVVSDDLEHRLMRSTSSGASPLN
jgi:hypothetical protein